MGLVIEWWGRLYEFNVCVSSTIRRSMLPCPCSKYYGGLCRFIYVCRGLCKVIPGVNTSIVIQKDPHKPELNKTLPNQASVKKLSNVAVFSV